MNIKKQYPIKNNDVEFNFERGLKKLYYLKFLLSSM
jgi:hypothetical protein